MTLREELEILRGEPIVVFDGDPMSIPCIETSDAEKLCKKPVVSVCMITYNHEQFIRQAIEGVMMQKTDFDFELVIGEDCSRDGTREICIEYQKRYPEKIRVLWWHENVSELGGNGRRNLAHCRGEFIAFCEGDDYWIDPLKLQKQVDVMQKFPSVSLVFTNSYVLTHETGAVNNWQGAKYYSDGLIKGQKFFDTYCYGANPSKGIGPEGYIMTASCMCRTRLMHDSAKLYDIFQWILLIGDKTLFLALSLIADSDVYYMTDVTTTYRKHIGGAMSTWGGKIFRDSSIVKIYFSLMNNRSDLKVPLSIMVPALCVAHRTNPLCSDIRFSVIKGLLARRHFSFTRTPLKQRLKWFIYFLTKNESVFDIRLRRFYEFLFSKSRQKET